MQCFEQEAGVIWKRLHRMTSNTVPPELSCMTDRQTDTAYISNNSLHLMHLVQLKNEVYATRLSVVVNSIVFRWHLLIFLLWNFEYSWKKVCVLDVGDVVFFNRPCTLIQWCCGILVSIEADWSSTGDVGDGADADVSNAVFKRLWGWWRLPSVQVWQIICSRESSLHIAGIGVFTLAP